MICAALRMIVLVLISLSHLGKNYMRYTNAWTFEGRTRISHHAYSRVGDTVMRGFHYPVQRQQFVSPLINGSERRLVAFTHGEDDTTVTFGATNNNIFALSATRRGGAMARKKKNKGKGGAPSSTTSGFGKGPPFSSSTSTLSLTDKKGSIYSLPALYDLAFGYRNYEEEVKFLLHAHRVHSFSAGGVDENENSHDTPVRILELAAGPARHSITALKLSTEGILNPAKIQSVTALDLSDEMVKYGNEIADSILGSIRESDENGDDSSRSSSSNGFATPRDRFNYVHADMRNFDVAPINGESYRGSTGGDGNNHDEPHQFDTAWILLGSMQHLTTNDDVISCFESAHNTLRKGGTVILELPHPRETFSMVECTRNGWEVPLEDENGDEYGELKIIWGDENDAFDPIRQVRDFTVVMELTGNGIDKRAVEGSVKEQLQSAQEVVPMRLFTVQEIDALARCAGFEMVAMYGALSEDVHVDDEDEAFRLVCIIRKV